MGRHLRWHSRQANTHNYKEINQIASINTSNFAHPPFFTVKNGGYSLPKELKLYEAEIREVLRRPHLQAQAEAAGFIQRSSKVTAEVFFYLLLYVVSLKDSCSLSSMATILWERCGIDICKQSIDERFNDSCVKFVKSVLKELISDKISAAKLYHGNFWNRFFNRIRIKDSTKFKIPDALQVHYKGNGGSLAAISIQYEFDLSTGKVLDLAIHSGNRNDYSDAVDTKSDVEKGDLVIRDLGYYTLETFLTFIAICAYFLSRYCTRTCAFYKDGTQVCFRKIYEKMRKTGIHQMEIEVYLGNAHRVPVRMILYMVSEEVYAKRVRDRKKEQKKRGGQLTDEMLACYHMGIYITNVSCEILPTEAIYPIYKLRWQVELMFKCWKSLFGIHMIGKMKEARFLCLLYAKLILIVINLQITYRIQDAIGTTKKGGQIQLLSLQKTLRTLTRHFDKLYCIIRAEKRVARDALADLFKILSVNHFLESKKNKIGLIEIIELTLSF